MALLKKPAKAKKQVVLANNNIDQYKKFDGKTLLQVDATSKLVGIHLGSNNVNGTDIQNLVLEYDNQMVAFPLSRGLSEDPTILLKMEELVDCQFQVRRKFDKANDTEGVYPYSGPEYISFGKPTGITFDSLENLVPAEEKENANP